MKSRHLKESFRHAFRGIYQAFRTERNVKIHTFTGIFAVAAGFFFHITAVEWAIVALVIGMVIVAELLNTAIEYTVDMVCGDTYNELAKYSKDIAAGATLVAAFSAVGVACVIFVPKLLELLN